MRLALATLAALAAAVPLPFPPASGWRRGATTPSACPGVPPTRCEQAWSWTGTVPWRDGAGSLPHRTLATLPRDGIVISLLVVVEHPVRAARRIASPPRVRSGAVGGLEGVPARVGVYQLVARLSGGRELRLEIFFGRSHPTRAQLARASARLAAVRL